jgi:hypothetical protein
MCPAGRWERSTGQARGRRPVSLPAAIAGQVNVYRSGSDARPWNCLVDRNPGDMETHGRYYTNINGPPHEPGFVHPSGGSSSGAWPSCGRDG